MAATFKLLFRHESDFTELAASIHRLVRDAYDRGTISWARRQEMLDNVRSLVELQSYDVIAVDPDELTVHIFGEPSPAFLAEIAYPVWEGRS